RCRRSGHECGPGRWLHDQHDVWWNRSRSYEPVSDEAGNKRTSQSDALGRMTAVWEDPSGLNYETDYAYDTLDNLTKVTQMGGAASSSWRTRTFTYDSLSRLKCAANPEVTSSVNTPASCPASDIGTYTPGTSGYTY